MNKESKNFTFAHADSHNYNETDCKNTVQSSLKSHPLWITLYRIDFFAKMS